MKVFYYVLMFICIFSLGYLMYPIQISKPEPNPLFKVNDCIAEENSVEPEKWEKKPRFIDSYKILELGKNNYHAQYWFGAGLTSDFMAEEKQKTSLSFKYTKYFKRIDCKTLEFIK